MKSFVIFETLYILSVFMIAIAASRCDSFSDYGIFSYRLLFIYNIGLLLFVFFETLCFYTRKGKRFRSHVYYERSKYLPFVIVHGLTFFAILGMREISYGDLTTENNIPAIRCVAVLLYIIFFHYSNYQQSRYMFYIFLLDFVLCILSKRYLYKMYGSKSCNEALIILAFLIFPPFTIQILKSVDSNSLNEINIIKQYAINSNPRKFRKQFLFAIENEYHFTNPTLVENIKPILDENYVIGHSYVLIDNVELIKENLAALQDDADIEECIELILRTVKKMDDVINAKISKHENKISSVVNSQNIKKLEDAVFYIFFLITVVQLFGLVVEHEKRHELADWTLFFDSKTVLYMLNETQMDNFDSFICLYMQLLLNYSRISGLVYTVLINICQTTFKIIYGQFQVIWKMTVFTMTLVINAFVFIFILHTISVLGTQFIESSVKQLTNIQHNIETTRHSISSYNQTTETTIFERYTGEDVLLHCSLNYNFREEWRKYKLLWTHNDIVIDEKGSDRVTVWTTYHDYFAESELKLVLIENDDFGTFRCILHEVQYIPVVYTLLWDGQIASYVFEIILSNIYRTRKYELRHTEILHNTYEIAEGTLIVFDIFAYHSYADFEDMSFLYTVNDIEIHDVCTHDWLSCKPSAYILKKFMGPQFNLWKVGRFHNFYRLSFEFCACSKIFGVHKLFLYREYYNKTSGKTESKEIEYPIGFLFLPKGNDTGIRKELFINNTREFINQYLEISDQIVIPMLFGSKLRISVYSSFNFIAFLLYMVVAIYVMKFVNFVIHLYCCLTIIPVKNLLIFGSIRQPVPQIENEHFAGILPCQGAIYDVYISHSENDNAFTEHVILPYIEQECTKTVCFPPREFAHEAGASLLHLYMTATEQSRQFIVVLSHSYLEDRRCNNLQLLTCILPLLAEQNGEKNILLVIKLEQVDLPVQICRNPRISVLDWTSCNDERYKLRKIKRFLSVFDNS